MWVALLTQGNDRINICHTRFIVEKKQNISLSFDPTSIICYSCVESGGHPVCIEEDGGGGGEEAMFHLGRPTKPFLQPCLLKKGNALKSSVLRMEVE